MWVRVPPPAPSRSKLHIACSDFFQKSERTHCAAPPFQTEPASLSFGLVVRFHWCGNLKQLYMESLRRLRLSAMTAFLRNCPGNLSGCNGRTHRFAPTVLKRSLPRIDVHPKFASTQRGYVHALQCSTEMYAYRGSFCRATPKGVAKQQRRRSRDASGRCLPREGAVFWGSSCRVTPKGVAGSQRCTKRDAGGRLPARQVWCCAKNASLQRR